VNMVKHLAGQCCISAISTVLQVIIAACFIVVSFYLASVALTPVRILGITQLPPGIVYANHQGRF